MKISIQIPTYNQSKFLLQAVESALAQTYSDIEIIVVDDCSTEYNVYELLDHINDPQLKIFRQESNVGRVKNYWFSLHHLVKGEYFINLDGDDFFIDPFFVSNAVEYIQKCEHNIVAYQADINTEKVIHSGIKLKAIDNNVFFATGLDLIKILDQNIGFSHASILFKTSEAKRMHFYDIDNLHSDYFSYLKILPQGNLIISNSKVYHWRRHDAQATKTINFLEVKKQFEALCNLEEVYRNLPKAIKYRTLDMLRMSLYYKLLYTYFDEDKSFSKTFFLLRRMRIKPKYIIPLLSNIKRYIISGL